ncbi:MAG: SWF/SNF helicase family protein [Bacteroidales bacterium]|nr:SWF/SNF helicase family protein [Bacteroidales bacterium]
MKLNIKFKKGRKTQRERDLSNQLNIDFLAELTKLRLAANDMRLSNEGWVEESSKILALKDILSSLTRDPENRILIFSQFTSFLELVGQSLQREGIDYLYLDGQTPMKERSMLVTKFQSGQCPVFLISLKAGGLGLNLTAANYVIMMDPWWNPSIEDQAADRAHRIGQDRIVTVIKMVSKHTIEEKILRLHESKKDISDAVLQGAGGAAGLTYEDMLELIQDPSDESDV